MFIWIEDWQMQCCGEAFKLWDTVEWTVVKWTFDLPNIKDLKHIDYNYENHEEDVLTINGIVSDIKKVYQYYDLDKEKNMVIPRYGILKEHDETEVHGYEPKYDDMSFSAYLVKLDDVTIINEML